MKCHIILEPPKLKNLTLEEARKNLSTQFNEVGEWAEAAVFMDQVRHFPGKRLRKILTPDQLVIEYQQTFGLHVEVRLPFLHEILGEREIPDALISFARDFLVLEQRVSKILRDGGVTYKKKSRRGEPVMHISPTAIAAVDAQLLASNEFARRFARTIRYVF